MYYLTLYGGRILSTSLYSGFLSLPMLYSNFLKNWLMASIYQIMLSFMFARLILEHMLIDVEFFIMHINQTILEIWFLNIFFKKGSRQFILFSLRKEIIVVRKQTKVNVANKYAWSIRNSTTWYFICEFKKHP
jgi:hypothetical protein